jgi:hypothetical protein
MVKGLKTQWSDNLGTKFGLAVNERHETTSSVLSARCFFCAKLGREEVNPTGRKRKRTVIVKTFVVPFRSDNIK